jgi:hypothetical protein
MPDFHHMIKIETKSSPVKTCGHCRMVKALSEFGQNRTTRDGKQCYCHNCRRTKHREWLATHPRAAKRHKQTRRARLKTRPGKRLAETLRIYGLTVADYAQLCERQNNKCAICTCTETKIVNGQEQRLSVDHDHDTGAVRGLLCSKCNSGLGLFRDDVALLNAAAVYLGGANPT